jgi:flagellar protein FlgJ
MRIFILSRALCLLLTFNVSGAIAADNPYSGLVRNNVLELSDLDHGLKSIEMLDKKTDKKVVERAKELEGVFLSVIIEPMFSEGKNSDLYGGGNGQGIFRTLMIQEYGKMLAEAGGVGLAAGIVKQLNNRESN